MLLSRASVRAHAPKRFKHLMKVSCSLAVLAVSVSPSLAQDSVDNVPQDGATLLQRLIFGAGQAKVATDTPQAVTALDQEAIDDKQAASLTDVVDTVPNVQVTGGANRPLGQSFNIRGIGKGETAADEGRIIVNVDGVPQFYEQYRMGGVFNDPELFKRVEILRGPASSTLYGSGALGGVVNFTTKDASNFLGEGDNGVIKLKGSWDSNSNGYLASTILALRLNPNAEVLFAGNYRQGDEFEDGFGNRISGSDFATPNGLVKGTFYLDDVQERVLRVSYSQFTSSEDNQEYSQLQPTGGFGTVDRDLNNRQAQISYEDAASDNPWLDLKLSLSYNSITNEQTNASLGAASSLGQDANYGYDSIQFLGENTFEWTGENFENYLTVGGQIIRQKRSTNTARPLGFHPEGTDFQAGIFIQNEFIWNDKLTLIPGLRIDYQRLTPNATVGAGAGIPAPNAESDFAFSPKLAALYEFNDNFSVFGSYAHTERFPSLDEIYSNDFGAGVAPNFSLGLRKEKSDNFELGFVVSGTDIFTEGDQFDLKTTGFYNRIEDLIVRQRRAYPQYRNVGEAEIYGVEVEAAYDSESVFAGLGFGLTIGNDLTNDSALTTVAPPEVSLNLGYKMPDFGLTFGYEGRYVFDETRVPVPPPGRFVNIPAEQLRRDGFSTQDLYASWRPDEDSRFHGWEGSFRVENLFDVGYRDFLANDNGKGRTFKLSLSRELSW